MQDDSEFTPKWIAWEITKRCNLNCIHCRSLSSMKENEKDFSTMEGKRVIDQISNYAKPVLVLSGGEPLLRKDVFDLLSHGTDRGLRMCLATNGTLITDDVCERLKESGVKMVSFSLDGSTSAIHDDFRQQKGSFDGALRGIELVKKHGIDFLINSSFTKRNQFDVENIYHLAKRLEASAWYMFMIVPTGRGKDIHNEFVSGEDYEDLLKWHYQIEKKEKGMFVRPTCAPQYYRVIRQEVEREGIQFERRNLKFSTGGAKGCIAGQNIAFIGSNEEVFPCSYFPKSAGSLKDSTFRDIWENSTLFRDLRAFENYRGRCGVCTYLDVCGGCRARAYSSKVDYLADDPYCTYIPKD